jgi:hypothetical protein
MDTCQSTRLNLVIHAPCPNWVKWGWKAKIGNWRKCEPNRTACISIVRLPSPQSQQKQGSTGRTVFQNTCTLQCTPVCFNIGHSTPTYNKTTVSVDTVLCTKKHSDGKTNMRRCAAVRTQIAVRLTQANAADANWIRTSKLKSARAVTVLSWSSARTVALCRYPGTAQVVRGACDTSEQLASYYCD